MNNFIFSQSKGSSALLRAHGSGGASATINKLAPQKNFRAKPKQAGKKEGSLGEGIFARLLLRAKGAVGVGSGGGFSVRRKAHKSVFPSLIEKDFGRGAQKGNCRKNAFVCSRRQAVRRRWAGHSSGLFAKKVRISSKQYRQFTISAFWGEIASQLRRSAGALRAPKPHFATLCHAPRGEKETAWFWIWKFAERSSDKMECYYQSFFVSPKPKHGSDNFNILTTSL